MGFLDNIKAKIFGTPASAAVPPSSATPVPDATPAAPLAPAQQAAVNAGLDAANKVIADAVAKNAAANTAEATRTASVTPTATEAAPTAQVDVAAILDAAVAASGQKLDWKTSIADLLKALDLDSSLTARKELADELGYTGDKSDSGTMNIWLHKQVLAQLKANGGKVPDTLLA